MATEEIDKILKSGIKRAKHSDGSEVEFQGPDDLSKSRRAVSNGLSNNGLSLVNSLVPKIKSFDD